MRTSEQINEIATALSKTQAKLEDAVKDSTNPHYKSDYATLSSVLEAVRKPLSENGLCIIQTTDYDEDRIILTTMLCHSSGQWLSSKTPLLMSKQDMQGLGSALSYARRYALAAIVGISQKDDDGEAVAGLGHSPAPKGLPTPQKPSEGQLKRLYAIVSASGWTDLKVKEQMYDLFKIESSKDLTLMQYNKLCELIENNPVIA